jgi:hypothetical protein
MTKGTSGPGRIHEQIIEVMKRFPEGVSAGQIRHALERMGVSLEDSAHLVGRIGELDKWFIIETTTAAEDERDKRQPADYEQGVSEVLRAQVLYAAHGRCQGCGRTIENDGITLSAQKTELGRYDKPVDRGDLWAVCQYCQTLAAPLAEDEVRAGSRPKCKGRKATGKGAEVMLVRDAHHGLGPRFVVPV